MNIFDKDKIFKFENEILFSLNTREWIQRQIWESGIYTSEYFQTKLFETLLKPGHVMFDIGAHVGYYTLKAASRVGKLGQVHAFEPIHENFSRLSRNIEINNLSNVKINHIGISDHNKIVPFFLPNEFKISQCKTNSVIPKSFIQWSKIKKTTPFWKFNSGIASIIPLPDTSQENVNIACTSIDQYVFTNKIAKVDFFKIDVEGAEMEVLLGMKETIENHKPTILIELHQGRLGLIDVKCEEILNWITNKGYFAFDVTHFGVTSSNKFFIPSYSSSYCFFPLPTRVSDHSTGVNIN